MTNEQEPFHSSLVLKCLIPSLLGIFLFLVPIKVDGNITIFLGVITDWLNERIGALVYQLNLVIYSISVVTGIYYLLAKPNLENKPLLEAIANVNLIWFTLRVTGTVIAFMVFFDVGPQVLRLDDTGQAVYLDIGVAFALIVLSACFLLPLLTEFGAMDFFGTLIGPVFKRIFKLPGRSAIDAIASFVSASNVGILVTAQQYRRNFYTGREAVTISTNFSVVSLPFALVIAATAGISDVFFYWYIASIVACLACAIITARIKPLTIIPDTFLDKVAHPARSQTMSDGSLLSKAINNALNSAQHAPSFKALLLEGLRMYIHQMFSVLAPSLAIATLTAAVAMHSSIGEWISLPITWILEALSVDEAQKVAPGFIFGFLDQFVPALIANQTSSEIMRFILAGLSLCQLIFISEVGLVILSVKLPVTVWQLFQIFVIRTIIVVPVLTAFAWIKY